MKKIEEFNKKWEEKERQMKIFDAQVTSLVFSYLRYYLGANTKQKEQLLADVVPPGLHKLFVRSATLVDALVGKTYVILCSYPRPIFASLLYPEVQKIDRTEEETDLTELTSIETESID